MVGRCLSCQAPVAEGLEVCEVCRTTQIPKLNLDSLSGPSKAALGRTPHLMRVEEVDASPFCGREDELGRLAALVERSLVQQKLHVALVHGAPGLGKSRMLRELGRVVTDHLGLPGDRILVGTMPGEAASAVSALTALVRTRCDIQVSEQPQSAREKLLRTTRGLLPAVRAAEVAHCLGDLLGVPFPEGHLFSTSLPVGMTASEVERPAGEPRTYVALKRFLMADASRSPLVLLLDEMEHATDETMSLINYLIDSLTELPVFVGIFARPEFVEKYSDFGSSTGGLSRIELRPMPGDALVELFCAAVNTEPEGVPIELLQRIAAPGDGSPRQVMDLFALLREFEVIIPERSTRTPSRHDPDGHPTFAWDLERLAELNLPDPLTLEGLIAARVAAMPEAERTLLEKAALCGEHFYFDALLMLQRCGHAGLGSTDEADDHSGAATADPEGPALDELFDPGDRATLQDTLALLMQKGLVSWVRDSRLRGEREYRFTYPPWRDIVYQKLPPAQRRRDHRLLAHWLLLHRDRDNEELLESVARHMERAGRGAAAAMFYRRVADLAAARGVHSKPPRLLLRALSCLGSADVAMRVGLWHDLGAALVHKGDFEAAFGAYEKLLRLAHALSVRHYLAQAHYALGQLTLHKGEPSQALEHLTRAFDEFTELGDSQGVSDSLDDLGQVLWRLGRSEEALDRAGRALELRRRLGDRRKVARSLLHIGAIEQHRGLVDPAVGCYEEAMRKHDGDPQLLAACLEALGSIQLLRGELQEARARFEQGLGLVEPLGPSPLVAVLMCRLGEALLQEGFLDEAERRLVAARELAFRLSDRRALAEIERLLGLSLLQRGQHKAALDSCQKALDQAQRNGMRHEIARALLALGQVHAATLFDETVEGAHPAWDCFRRSVTLLREVGDQAELAVALYQLGRHLIERGRLGPARNTLREAEQLATKLRMQQASEMRQLLAAL